MLRWYDGFARTPRRLALDMDDAGERTCGERRLSLFNAHHDSHRFMPIHIREAITGKPVAVFPRPCKTRAGTEVAPAPRHVVAGTVRTMGIGDGVVGIGKPS